MKLTKQLQVTVKITERFETCAEELQYSLNLIDFHVFLIAIFIFSDFSREKTYYWVESTVACGLNVFFMGGIFFFI